jgi:hypothetical protein
MQKLTIYTKLNCHLCEQAYYLLMNLAYDTPLEIDLVDITRFHHIEKKYLERIPVLAKPGTETELNWPFTIDDIRAYLADS